MILSTRISGCVHSGQVTTADRVTLPSTRLKGSPCSCRPAPKRVLMARPPARLDHPRPCRRHPPHRHPSRRHTLGQRCHRRLPHLHPQLRLRHHRPRRRRCRHHHRRCAAPMTRITPIMFGHVWTGQALTVMQAGRRCKRQSALRFSSCRAPSHAILSHLDAELRCASVCMPSESS